MTIIGGVMAPVGFVMLGADMKYDCTHVEVCAAGTALGIAGTALLVGGLVAMIVGKNTEAEARAQSAWIPGSIAVSPRDLSLGWHF